jgi:hypothetical protein
MSIQLPDSTCPFGRGLTWYTYRRQEKKIVDAIRYTAIDPDNLNSWGEVWADVLRSIGDDVDSCFRETAKCVERNCGSSGILSIAVNARRGISGKRDFKDWNIVDYKEVFEPVYELSHNTVQVPYGLRGIPPLTPFQDFAVQGAPPLGIPPWWNGYNQIKHQYYEKMNEGKMENALSALAGLLLVNLLHKCSQYYLVMTGAVKGGIKLGQLEQPAAPQFVAEELQKSSVGVARSSAVIDVAWLETEVFYFEFRKV